MLLPSYDHITIYTGGRVCLAELPFSKCDTFPGQCYSYSWHRESVPWRIRFCQSKFILIQVLLFIVLIYQTPSALDTAIKVEHFLSVQRTIKKHQYLVV